MTKTPDQNFSITLSRDSYYLEVNIPVLFNFFTIYPLGRHKLLYYYML